MTSPIIEGDPRLSGAAFQLEKIEKIIVVLSTKGGVGKSTIASLLGLAFAENVGTGLLDTDFANPSLHAILGADPSTELEEEMGVKPYRIHENLLLLSPVFFSGDAALPLRGNEDLDALLELLTIGNWGDTKILIIDTPPGLGDTQLGLFHILKKAAPGKYSAVVVSTTSQLSLRSVARALPVIEETGGVKPRVIVNMAPRTGVPGEIGGYSVIGAVCYDQDLEKALGRPGSLKNTKAYKDVLRLAESL